MTLISTTTIAMTRRTWMNPPIVYEVTKPSAQRTSKMTAMVQSIFRNLLPRNSDVLLLHGTMVILSDGLVHRHPSERRIAVCLILGPVFVLWIQASFAEGT